MGLATGDRLGPYEILAPLGAGGMGEVYRARDTRLSREVAIKVLPASYASDPGRLRRFEQEAQAASGLNHPNIVAVYDVGSADAVSFIAMELVDGKTVRDLTSAGPLPFKRALSIAAQAADGLSKAHAAGIVHRDLKPENLMVSSDGFVKILDFGLAKLVEEETDGASGALTAAGPRTGSGIVVGTVGYMSPEQVSGEQLDFRSDQFALGSVLYEMVTGRRAFARATPVDTLSAILHEEPEPAGALRTDTPTGLRWLLERCLAKEPDERYASTRDLARDLATLRDRLGEASGAGATVSGGARRRHRGLALAAVAAAALGAGIFFASLLRKGNSPPLLQWEPLSFRRGMIWSGRFAPDGQIVVYSAAWDGDPVRMFATRQGAKETRALDLPSARILGVSPRGEMAFLRDPRFLFFFLQPGTLARAALEGGAARDLLEDVDTADWSPDGDELAVSRRVAGRTRLEYPVGKVLYETGSTIGSLRVSRDGAWIAFFEYPDTAKASVAVVHVADGKKRVLSDGWSLSSGGLAWSADGNEVWFTAQTEREQRGRPLRAVTLAGKPREVTSVPGQMRLLDIAPDGRALVASWDVRLSVRGFGSDAGAGRELSWLDRTFLQDLSNDGRTIIFTDHDALFLRRTDGSPPVRLGEGYSFDLGRLSPDGKWVLTVPASGPRTLLLVPTGAGEIRRLDAAPPCDTAEWFPDGKRILCGRGESGGKQRLFVVALENGKASPTALPADVRLVTGVKMVSPDGHRIATLDPDGGVRILSLETGHALRQIPSAAGYTLIGWAEDGRSLFLYRIGDVPEIIQRLDIDTGTREAWKELTLEDLAGLIRIHPVLVTPDGRSGAFSYSRVLSDLYVVAGLK